MCSSSQPQLLLHARRTRADVFRAAYDQRVRVHPLAAALAERTSGLLHRLCVLGLLCLLWAVFAS